MSWPINVVTLTQAAAGSVLFRRGGEAALRATIVVKACFRMLHDKPAELAPPRDLVRADQASASGTSLAVASELAPYLPGAGVILTGHAHAPEGKPTQAMSVRLAIYRDRALIDKTIHVLGPRQAPGAPPWSFQKMPLVLERAYGGPSFDDNPAGTGASPGSPLPTLVDPRSPARAACFAPIAKTWPARRRLFGAVDPASLDRAAEAIVELPNGFDFRALHAAPADQQIDTLRGDEWIILDGLHPTLPRVQTRLPEPRAVARIYMVGSNDGNDVSLYADTLVIDTDTLTCAVIWRGHLMLDHPAAIAHAIVYAGVELPGAPVRWPEARDLAVSSSVIVRPAGVSKTSIEDLSTEDVTLIQRMPHERPGSTTIPEDDEDKLATTGRIDKKRLGKPATPFRQPAPGERIEAAVPDAAPKPRPIALGSTAPTTTLSPFAARPLPFKSPEDDRPRGEPAATTLAPEDMPLATEAIDLRKLAARRAAIAPFAIAEAGTKIEPPTTDLPGAPWSNAPSSAPIAQPIEAAIAQPPPLAQVAPLEPAPLIAPPERVDAPPIELPSPPAEAAPPPLLIAAPAPPIEPQPEAPPRDATKDEAPPRAARAPAKARSAAQSALRERALVLIASEVSLDGVELAGVDLSGVDLRDRSLVKANLRGASLRGANLAGAALDGAILAEADLGEAVLDRARLAGADLTSATIDGASFRDATLDGARLEGARGEGASFDGAKLAEAILDRAEIERGSFAAISAAGSSWERAALAGARAAKAKLGGANLQRATMSHADLSGADLTNAKLQRLDAEGATFDKADLSGADLRKARLVGASLRGASLARAQLDKAELDRAALDGADLSGASLRGTALDNTDRDPRAS